MTEQVTKIYNKLNDVYVAVKDATSEQFIYLQNSLNEVKQDLEILISQVNDIKDEDEKKPFQTDIDIISKEIDDTQKLLDEKTEQSDPNYKYKKYLKYALYGVGGLILFKFLRRK